MIASKSGGALAASLVFAVFLWGGNNTAIKFIVHSWPPILTGSTRFLCAGGLILALMRWTNWLGAPGPGGSACPAGKSWWPASLSLAAYILSFNTAMCFTTASNVALCLGASPVWALLWEGRPKRSWRTVQRFAAATLALAGVFILFWPSLKMRAGQSLGDLLGLCASLLWTNYGRQCRRLGASVSGVQITAQTMWRAAVLTLPLAVMEWVVRRPVWRNDLALAQLYGIVFGGVVAFALWNNALRHWPTSQVFLFNNLIPISTVAWAHYCLGEPISPTFWPAMLMVVAGVLLGQAKWERLLGARWVPSEG